MTGMCRKIDKLPVFQDEWEKSGSWRGIGKCPESDEACGFILFYFILFYSIHIIFIYSPPLAVETNPAEAPSSVISPMIKKGLEKAMDRGKLTMQESCP